MKRYFDLGGSHLPLYNLFIGLGIALAMVLLQYNKKFIKYSSKDQHIIHLSLLIAIIGGFICAYVFDAISQNIALNSFKSGLTLLGGLVPGIALLIIVLFYGRVKILSVLNMLTPYFAITHCMGRLGCFFAGCCFGLPTHASWGITFPKGSIPFQYYNKLLPIHPTQIYEAVFVIGLSVAIFYIKPRNSFFIYMILYSIFRFFLEFLRADDRGTLFDQKVISPSQIICMAILVIALFWLKTSKKTLNNSILPIP